MWLKQWGRALCGDFYHALVRRGLISHYYLTFLLISRLCKMVDSDWSKALQGQTLTVAQMLWAPLGNFNWVSKFINLITVMSGSCFYFVVLSQGFLFLLLPVLFSSCRLITFPAFVVLSLTLCVYSICFPVLWQFVSSCHTWVCVFLHLVLKKDIL